MSDVGGILVAAVPASTIIVVLVQIGKQIGVPREASPLLAMALGVLYTVGAHLVQLLPSFRGWYEAIGAGLTIGLSAMGLYSGSKAMFRYVPTPGSQARRDVMVARVRPALGDGSGSGPPDGKVQ